MYPTPLRGPPLNYTAFSFFEISRTPSPEVPPILLRSTVNFYVLDTPSSLTTSFRSLSHPLPPTASHVPPPLCHRSDRRAQPRRCHTIGSMICNFYRTSASPIPCPYQSFLFAEYGTQSFCRSVKTVLFPSHCYNITPNKSIYSSFMIVNTNSNRMFPPSFNIDLSDQHRGFYGGLACFCDRLPRAL